MYKKVFVIFLSLIFAILQVSLYLRNVMINLPFLFLVYLIFFYDINYSLLAVGISGLLMDFFAINFGAYFIALLITCLFLYYVYHNILANDKLSTYLLLSFLGLVIFHLSYYLYNFFVKILSQGFYLFQWEVIFKEFLLGLIINLIICFVLYILTNILSHRTKNKLLIIGGG